MKFAFKDIFNDSLYSTANVILVTGQYAMFNNIVVDKCRNMCKSELDDIDIPYLKELSMSLPMRDGTMMEGASSNSVTLEKFFDVYRSAPLDGKWFCSINYEALTKKEQEKLVNYFKLSSSNGLLVVTITDWKDYRQFLKKRDIAESKKVHLLQLSFPSRVVLKDILRDTFKGHGYKVRDEVLDLFIMRMSNAYDSYKDTVDIVIQSVKDISTVKEITMDQMKEALSGIENYVLDDFITELTKRMGSNKVSTNRKIYKMYKSLLDTMGAVKLVRTLRAKIDTLIELRLLINNGVIPIRIRYSVKEVKDRIERMYPEEDDILSGSSEDGADEKKSSGSGSSSGSVSGSGETSEGDTGTKKKKAYKKLTPIQSVKALTTFSFKKYARISSLTSLRDWYYIKMMLYRADGKYVTEEEAQKIILSIIHRSVLNISRLINDIGVDNIIESELYELNTVLFNEYIPRVGEVEKEVAYNGK